jgi:deoxyribodipyrimidine photolyase-related protein
MLKHTNKLSDKFWTGTTGILPIDSIIKKIVKYSYAHHIERLMYLGNFLLISMIDPKEVYRIFMEWTIDSYDWVMVPNIFGMSQYATNNMMTRPYFSSSNYIIRMSNYKKDGEWDKIWDSLYYNFIDKHIDMLKSNYATAMMAKHWNNKTDDMKKDIKKIAKDFIKNIY